PGNEGRSATKAECAGAIVQDGAGAVDCPVAIGAATAADIAERAVAPQRDGIARAQRTGAPLVSQNLGAERDDTDAGVAGKGVDSAQGNCPARIAGETERASAERPQQFDIGSFRKKGRPTRDIAGD